MKKIESKKPTRRTLTTDKLRHAQGGGWTATVAAWLGMDGDGDSGDGGNAVIGVRG